jgi:hypothetical protein
LFPSFHTVRNDIELEARQLNNPGTDLRILLYTLRRRAPSAAGTTIVPTSTGTVESSSDPSPPAPTTNNGGKGKGKGKGKSNGSDGSSNNSGGYNTPRWPSFYNP